MLLLRQIAPSADALVRVGIAAPRRPAGVEGVVGNWPERQDDDRDRRRVGRQQAFESAGGIEDVRRLWLLAHRGPIPHIIR